MLTIIHGDDTQASRNYFHSEKQKAADKKLIDGNTTTLTDLMQIFSGNGLFGDQEAIFIEELLSKRKSQKDIEDLVTFVAAQTDATVFLWESKSLTPKQLVPFKNATVKEFKIPVVVFTFLDALKPGNSQQLIKLYHSILEHEDAGYVLVMLIRHVRILLALMEHVEPTISEVTRMAPWQKTKLQKQAKLFTREQLFSLHDKLFQLEYGQKTGNLTTSLPDSIDFFLLGI